MRYFDLGEPTGGKTFRVTLEMRSTEPFSARGCTGVWLQTWGEGGKADCLRVVLDDAWQQVEHTWTAPQESTSSIIRVILNDFDGLSYDVKNVRLYQQQESGWRLLAPLTPEAATLSLQWQGQQAGEGAALNFAPTEDWATYKLEVGHASLRRADLVTAHLQLGTGLAIAVRNFQVHAGGAETPLRPIPISQRRSLWYGHPNIAGHTVVLAGLALFVSTRSTLLSVISLLLVMASLWLTGSRAAFLAALLGFPPLLWLISNPKERRWLFPLLALGAALFLAVFGLDSLGRLQVWQGDEGNPTSRVEIWRLAWQAFLERPWTGIGPEAFSDFWRATYAGDSNEMVTHAHNLWLQFAASYGIAGLLSILWLTGGFLVLAWRWGRWRGLALVVPVFVMQLFDYTFFYSGVLFPLILGMNALRSESKASAGRPSVDRA